MNREIIDSYSPTEHAKYIVRSTPIVLLAGISGAGKNTVKQELLNTGDFMDVISHTTRKPRTNDGRAEKDGVDYYFVDDKAMIEMAENHEFVEIKQVHGGTMYGTSVASLENIYNEHKIAVTDIDIQGVKEYKNIAHEVMAVFLVPPSYEEWVERFRNRYDGDVDRFSQDWPRRFGTAIIELETVLTTPYYHFIINDDIDRVVAAIRKIAKKGDQFHRRDDEVRLEVRDLLNDLKEHA